MRQASLILLTCEELNHDGLDRLLTVQLEGGLDCPSEPEQLMLAERARLLHLRRPVHEKLRARSILGGRIFIWFSSKYFFSFISIF